MQCSHKSECLRKGASPYRKISTSPGACARQRFYAAARVSMARDSKWWLDTHIAKLPRVGTLKAEIPAPWIVTLGCVLHCYHYYVLLSCGHATRQSRRGKAIKAEPQMSPAPRAFTSAKSIKAPGHGRLWPISRAAYLGSYPDFRSTCFARGSSQQRVAPTCSYVLDVHMPLLS